MLLLLPFGILLLIIILLILKNTKKLTRKKGIICTLVIFLLFPYIVMMYKDGGSKVIWAPVYQLIHWNQLDAGPENPGLKGWEFHIFPNNFHGLSYWYKKHKSEAAETDIQSEHTDSAVDTIETSNMLQMQASEPSMFFSLTNIDISVSLVSSKNV